jgi:hypothetical protein
MMASRGVVPRAIGGLGMEKKEMDPPTRVPPSLAASRDRQGWHPYSAHRRLAEMACWADEVERLERDRRIGVIAVWLIGIACVGLAAWTWWDWDVITRAAARILGGLF